MADLFLNFNGSFLKYMTWWHHTCLCWIWSCHHWFWKEWFVWTIFHSDFCCKWPLGCHGQMGPPPFFVAFPNCSTCISMIIVVFLMYTSTQHPLLFIYFTYPILGLQSSMFCQILFLGILFSRVMFSAVFNSTIRPASHSCLGCHFQKYTLKTTLSKKTFRNIL